MPKATYMSETMQYGTPQISVGGMSMYSVRPLEMAQKWPSDYIGAVADLLNTGNVDLNVNISVAHIDTDNERYGGGGEQNVSIPIGGSHHFDSGPIPLSMAWKQGVYSTQISIFDADMTEPTPIPTVGDTLIPLAWQLNIVTEVTISNFAVY